MDMKLTANAIIFYHKESGSSGLYMVLIKNYICIAQVMLKSNFFFLIKDTECFSYNMIFNGDVWRYHRLFNQFPWYTR